MCRSVFVSLLSMLLLVAALTSQSLAEDNPFNVDVSFGWDGCYRPMDWVPLEIGISSTLTDPFGGVLSVSAEQDGLTTMNLAHQFVLTPDLPLHIPLVTKLSFNAGNCRVRLMDDKGRVCMRDTYDLWDYSTDNRFLTPVDENDMLIGVIGRRSFGLMALPKQTHCWTPVGSGSVYVKNKLPRMVPWDWTGFESLDALVVYDPDWEELNNDQSLAIVEWVRRGGTLLLVLGAHPLSPNHPIAELLPFSIGQPQEIAIDSAALSDWGLSDGPGQANSADQDRAVNYTSTDASGGDNTEQKDTRNQDGPTNQSDAVNLSNQANGSDKAERNENTDNVVTAWSLVTKLGSSNSRCEYKEYSSPIPLVASASIAFGRIGVITFDPSQLSHKSDKTAVFWTTQLAALFPTVPGDPKLSDDAETARKAGIRVVGRRGRRGQVFPGMNVSNSFPCRTIRCGGPDELEDDDESYQRYGMYELGQSNVGLNAVLEGLLTIRELRPLSIWWVIGLLVLLTVLLGPVDYFVLKKLDRQPLTWITTSLCIVVFTVGAYYGVHAIRSGRMQLRAVSVVDAVQDEPMVCSTVYSGLFAPKTRAYELEGLRDRQWWSAIAPTQDAFYSFGHESASRNLYCRQHDGSNLPTSVPINIWSMQCLMTESTEEQLPIRATVECHGNTATLDITNESDQPITAGYVRFADDRIMRFPAVPPLQSARFSNPINSVSPWQSCLDGYSDSPWGHHVPSGNFQSETAFFACGTSRRTHAIETHLANGAAVVCVRYDDAATPFSIKNNRCDVNHVRLVRSVVFPSDSGNPGNPIDPNETNND